MITTITENADVMSVNMNGRTAAITAAAVVGAVAFAGGTTAVAAVQRAGEMGLTALHFSGIPILFM